MTFCHACKKPVMIGREVGRKDECPSCHADLRCCLNCRFYDAHAPKQCREPQADLVREKAKANFCDFFRFADQSGPAPSGGAADGARAALDDLFKK